MKSPVLFLIFKRPDTTEIVFDRIREVQPPKLYIAADGPRENRPDEIEKCNITRKITEKIDWPCEVHRLYQEKNLGCGLGVSTAISWFFEHEEEGIIIEDDIIAHPDFFSYCDEMLEKYRDDNRIQLVTGRNSFFKSFKHDSCSYYLSNYFMIWGWASWRRVWKTYQFDVSSISEERFLSAVRAKIDPRAHDYVLRIFRTMKDHKCDTWDYQFYINQILFNRYSIIPFVNMVENIGMNSSDATHTKGKDVLRSKHKAHSSLPIVHPQTLQFDERADYCFARNEGIIPGLFKKVTRKVRAILNNRAR